MVEGKARYTEMKIEKIGMLNFEKLRGNNYKVEISVNGNFKENRFFKTMADAKKYLINGGN